MYVVLSVLSQEVRGLADWEGEEGRVKQGPGTGREELNNGSRKQFKSKVLKMVMYYPSTSRCWVWRGAVDWRD